LWQTKIALPQTDALGDSSNGGAVRRANDAKDNPWWRRLCHTAGQTTLVTVAGGWSTAERGRCWSRRSGGGAWAALLGWVGCAARARLWHMVGIRGRTRERDVGGRAGSGGGAGTFGEFAGARHGAGRGGHRRSQRARRRGHGACRRSPDLGETSNCGAISGGSFAE
jgi:hypothetical protein